MVIDILRHGRTQKGENNAYGSEIEGQVARSQLTVKWNRVWAVETGVDATEKAQVRQ